MPDLILYVVAAVLLVAAFAADGTGHKARGAILAALSAVVLCHTPLPYQMIGA